MNAPLAAAPFPAAWLRPEILRSWLALQCSMVPGVSAGMVALGDRPETLRPAALWPVDRAAAASLVDLSRLALARREPVVAGAGADADPPASLEIAHPLEHDGRTVGVVAVEVAASHGQQQALIGLMRWGAAFLALAEHAAVPGRPEGGDEVTGVMAEMLRQDGVQASATALAGELARRTGSDRVSVGLLQDRRMRLVAVSDTARFDGRTQIARGLEAAMDEVLEHERLVSHPEPGPAAARTTHAVARLARATGRVVALPLVGRGRPVGALVLEREDDAPLDDATLRLVESAASLAAPVLALEQAEERPLLARLRASLASPRAHGRQLALIATLTLLAATTLVQGTYRVSAPAALEGTVHRAVVVPYDGFVVSAGARAGDTVAAGDVLAELDDRDLRLSLRRLEGERDELEKQRGQAFASQDYTQVRILETRIAQSDARIELAREQIDRKRLVAPFDGVVVTGDLSRSLGSPVERGEVLFEIAPLDAYRVALEVPDRDIADVSVGHKGELALSALPGRRLGFEVSSVSSVSRDEDGRAAYRVEARLLDAPAQVRPGMGGVAKVTAGRRALLDAWTRPLTNRVRLWLWTWLP